MKRIFILVSFVIFCQISFGQVYQLMPQYGYQALRMSFDSTLQIPTVCGVPTLKSVYNTRRGAIAFDSCNNRFYTYNPKTFTWSYLGGGGGSQNLQSVTDIGNTTTNDIKLNKLYFYDPQASWYSMNIKVEDETFYIHSDTFNTDIFRATDGYIQILNNTASSVGTISTGNITGTKTSELPNVNATLLASINNTFADVNGNVSLNIIDSLKRSTDSVFAKRNGNWVFQYKDSVGGGSSQNGRFGNDTATVVMAKIHNNSGSTLTNGKVVFLASSGTNSDAPSVRLANNKHDSTSANTFGFVSGTIASNDTGYVVLSGKIEKLNTSAFSNGDIIYLDSISGNWTKTKPVAPYHMVYLGVVIKANAGNGSIFVKCQNGYELSEIHDCQINNPLNNQIIVYSDTQKVWKNRTIYSVVDTVNTIATKTNVAAKVNISDTASMLTNYAKTSAVNLKVNISDTATMLTNYAKNSSVALKLNISDSATMLSKYLRKTDTASLSTRIDARIKYTDSSSMLTPYLRKTDTSTLSTRIDARVKYTDTSAMLTNYSKTSTVNTKLNITDTTAFDRKSVAAFTFRANNTASTANVTDQVFRDSSTLTYNGTITWTGTTAPSGATSHRYRWFQIGKMVTITFTINYATAGNALSAVKLTLPVGCPNPTNFGTLTGANDVLGSAWAFLGTATSTVTTGRVLLQNNATNNGYEFNIAAASANYKVAGFTITYFTD